VDQLKLHEAWFEIATRISNGGDGDWWICNIAKKLYRTGDISYETLEQIHARVHVERVRQESSAIKTPPTRGSTALWLNVTAHSNKGKIVRLRFIAKELRRLAEV